MMADTAVSLGSSYSLICGSFGRIERSHDEERVDRTSRQEQQRKHSG